MSRFKVSKFKNAIPTAAKKEGWIHDLNVGSLNSFSNHIKASCKFLAFHHDSTSVGSLAVLPLGTCGRNTSFPTISGHAGFITDFDFSPFNNMLSTGSEDCTVKLWEIPEDGIRGSLSIPKLSLGPLEKRIESVQFNSAADNILLTSSGPTVEIWDVVHAKRQFGFGEHEDVVQSVSWKGDGSLVASICKNGNAKKMRVWDPRSGSVAMETKAHSGAKESQVVWLGSEENIASSGFSTTRDAQVLLWDTRNFNAAISSQNFGTTVGSPMIFYDEDIKMMYVAVKGESAITFYELTEKSPYLSPGSNVYRSTLQHKGLALAPKRSCYVMGCQVAKFYQLTKNAVVPIGFYIQRKSYRDFHSDLFPDTKSDIPAMTAEEWLGGANERVSTVSLDPSKAPKPSPKVTAAKSSKEEKATTLTDGSVLGKPAQKENNEPTQKKPSSPEKPLEEPQVADEQEVARNPKLLNIVRTSKFRHIEGIVMHKSTHIDSIPELCRTVPGDSNAVSANSDRMATALKQAGGQIAVLELNKPGRMSSNPPTVQNKGSVMDFAFDPFNNRRLVVACDDCYIRVWTLPKDGLTEMLTEPDFKLTGHEEKCNVVLFHPQASSILTTAGYDCKIIIWSLDQKTEQIMLDPLPEPLFAMAWSLDGSLLATVCKDNVIRIFDPRKSTAPIYEGKGPIGSRGARVAWVGQDCIVVSGFDGSSARQLQLFDIKNLKEVKSTVKESVSPAILHIHFDQDTNVIFLYGKGETSILAYEYIPDEAPYLHQISGLNVTYPQQGVVFLPKNLCDVRKVEIAKAVRLCKSHVEPICFKVPRVRTEFFQDDVFPDTRAVWEPALTAEEWLKGDNRTQRSVSLQPVGMTALSKAPKPKAAPKKYQSYDPNYKTDEQKKEELLAAMSSKLEDKEGNPLPQDTMEGVDDDEWDD